MRGMKKRSHNRVVFKPYLQDQLQLPTKLDELVPAGHLVRVVNGAIERMDLKPLLRQYTGGGASSYHPKMMLKVLVYAYTQQIYTSRRIAKALRENVHFMWLSGNSHPDFRTINRFRGEVMRGIIQEVFPDYHGVVWYWHAFTPEGGPADGDDWLLKCEFVDYYAEFWLNGKPVGSHEGGEMPSKP